MTSFSSLLGNSMEDLLWFDTTNTSKAEMSRYRYVWEAEKMSGAPNNSHGADMTIGLSGLLCRGPQQPSSTLQIHTAFITEPHHRL